MTTERAREVAAIRARHADESGAFCGVAYSWRQAHEDRAALLSILSADVTREALAATPTPPRTLTEAPDHVGASATDLWRCAAAWDPDVRLLGNLTAREIAEVARRAMGASRGEIPPEVRPQGCNRHSDCDAADRSFVAANGRSPTRAFHSHDPDDDYPAPEMAVTTGEDADRWAPRPGARTMTAPFVVQPERRAAPGEIIRQCGERDFVVMHDDGTQAHYDADELGPEPTEKPGLCDEPAPRIAPRAARYAAVMKHDARIQAGLGRDETEPPPAKPPRFDPLCACGAPLSAHDAAGQYDPCPGGGGQFRDPPTGVPSGAGPAGLDVARKAGGGQ